MYSQILIKINSFVKKRFIEFSGILLVITSIFLLISILSYDQGDPSLTYTPETNLIKNLGGFYGSAIADFILQSIGLVSFFIIINLFNWGFTLIKEKKIDNFITKVFFTFSYIIFGTTYLNISYNYSYWINFHGNGGFVGRIIKEFFYSFTNIIDNQYINLSLLILAIVFFILSLNLKIKEIIKILSFPYFIIKKVIVLFERKKKSNTNIDNANLHIDIKDSSDNILKERQQILPFKTNNETKITLNKFKLPSINFLEKNPDLKNTKNNNNIELNKNSEFLEKILLDFGVEGKIKRISCGPVVTLNEFEPASGIKVSKIVNLTDDIARYTSSISARLATIPGKNTIGIEIPNSKRENVFLNEIIADEQFNKKEIKLPIALGKSISGVPIVSDLSAMPHLLIAGTTGSGKSVCINTIILSLLYKYSPEK
ncbi:MAG: DNA translocase FtsK, partial [Alphaproteobacteria bacterium]